MTRHSTRPTNAPPRAAPELASISKGQRARRDRIVRAARQMMVEVDYGKLQVRDVADQAGVALGTLYRYFTSKDHLLACAIIDWVSGFGERIDRVTADSTLERVQEVYRVAARAFEREPLVFDVLIHLQASKEPETVAAFREFATLQAQAFTAALGDLPSPDREDILVVMNAVFAESLRSRSLGVLTQREVYARLARAAELLLR